MIKTKGTIGQQVQAEMARILDSQEHKTLFCEAAELCHCPASCPCSDKVKCNCAKNNKKCQMTCKSCGEAAAKPMKKASDAEIMAEVAQSLIKASEILDQENCPQAAGLVLQYFNRAMEEAAINKMADSDLNDIRVKQFLDPETVSEPFSMEDSMAELESDPDYLALDAILSDKDLLKRLDQRRFQEQALTDIDLNNAEVPQKHQVSDEELDEVLDQIEEDEDDEVWAPKSSGIEKELKQMLKELYEYEQGPDTVDEHTPDEYLTLPDLDEKHTVPAEPLEEGVSPVEYEGLNLRHKTLPSPTYEPADDRELFTMDQKLDQWMAKYAKDVEEDEDFEDEEDDEED